MLNEKKALGRREFLKGVALTGAALGLPYFVPGKVLGKDGDVAPSEKIVMGAIGIGARGQHDLGVFLNEKVVRFAAICDIRRERREHVKNMADQKYGNKDCAMYRDMHEILQRDDIDAMLIATGDRWHALASIITAKAGKDIYCEKPLSLTIEDSRALADTVDRYGRIYQAGTQRRNIGNFQLAAKIAHSGKLGKLTRVHANTLHPATTNDWLPEQPLPEPDVIDWDRWLGPCPWRPYNISYTRGNWRGFFDFHGGGILEWGTHTVDLCQWGNQSDDTVPVKYWPVTEGASSIDDAPSWLRPQGVKMTDNKGVRGTEVRAIYANGVELVMRDRGWLGLGTCSCRYEGEEGWVETGDSGRMAVSSDTLRSEIKVFHQAGTDPVNHIREFLECVKTRRNPASSGKVAANAHIACHCAYIAWQLNREVEFDPVTETFVNDPEANRMISRAKREPWRL
ncbi:MAG: Gfo/Idh/MocA family oxidoreductase [Planctomycetaceae bacterium]|jgi:predicted dehydrogenase|nr:Gfo/Idh/MocA family oxidoreductase [Planctomycetaceae bacterium]